MKLNFNLRKAKTIKETPVVLIIRWNKEFCLVYPTHEKIKPVLWNLKEQKVRSITDFVHSSYSNYEVLNHKLDKIKDAAKQVWSEWNKNEVNIITPSEFRKLLDILLERKSAHPKTLMEFLQEYHETGEDRILQKTGTHAKYNTSKQFTQLYNLIKYYKKTKSICFRDFETTTYKKTFEEFIRFMTDVKGYARNTCAGHIKNLKIVLDAARDNRYIRSKDYKEFKFGFEEVNNIALSIEELDAIQELDLSTRDALEKQRDLFIIAAWTALRFSDLIRIKPQHIEGDFIKINTVKTGKMVIIPIMQQARMILEKYNYQLPKALSNQKYNKAIKEFAQMVPELHKISEIKKTIAGKKVVSNLPKWKLCSSHTCRRSACTNFYKMGFPVSMIMKISGHTSENNFFKYIKISEEDAALKMMEQYNRMMMQSV